MAGLRKAARSLWLASIVADEANLPRLFRQLKAQHHPDKAVSPSDKAVLEEEFKEIFNCPLAAAILIDPLYDASEGTEAESKAFQAHYSNESKWCEQYIKFLEMQATVKDRESHN